MNIKQYSALKPCDKVKQIVFMPGEVLPTYIMEDFAEKRPVMIAADGEFQLAWVDDIQYQELKADIHEKHETKIWESIVEFCKKRLRITDDQYKK